MLQNYGKLFESEKNAPKSYCRTHNTIDMKNTTNIRDLLGFKQHEVALLLNVSRSQWSLFELGKRDLPLAAKQLLTELLTHVQSPETAAKSLPHHAKQHYQNQRRFEYLIQENEYQQLRIAREIVTTQKKHETKTRALQVTDYLTHRTAQKGSAHSFFLQSLATKASKALETEGTSALLIELNVKQELLILEKMMLEAKLRNINKNINNTGARD